MSNPVSLEKSARRMLLAAHVLFVCGVVAQIIGLALGGTTNMVFLEGLALSIFALWISISEGGILFITSRYPLPHKIESLAYTLSLPAHLLLLAATHGLTFKYFS